MMDNIQDAKRKLIDDFIALRRMNAEMISDLIKYTGKNNVQDVIFMQGLTFSKCIDILKQVRDVALTDDNYDAVNQSNSMENIKGVAANIDIQIRHHKEVRNLFDYYISTN